MSALKRKYEDVLSISKKRPFNEYEFSNNKLQKYSDKKHKFDTCDSNSCLTCSILQSKIDNYEKTIDKLYKENNELMKHLKQIKINRTSTNENRCDENVHKFNTYIS